MSSNTMDNETKSNLEKAIAKQILDPIQSKYNDLKKQKTEKDIKDTKDKLTSKTSFLDRPDEASADSKEDYTDTSDSSKPSGQSTTIPFVEQQQLPLPPVSQALVMSPPGKEFKSYLIGLKDSITDTDNGDDYEVDSENQKELVQLIDDKLTWLESNPNASYDVIAKQQDQLRNTIEDKASSISKTWHDTQEDLPPVPPADTKGRCIAESYEINPEKQCNLKTKEPLKRAQRRLHPDKNPGCEEAATKKFQDLTNACEKYIVKQPEEETKEPEAQPEEPEEKPEEEPKEPEEETKEPSELDKSVKLTEKIKPDASKAAAALQTLIDKTKKEEEDIETNIKKHENIQKMLDILPVLLQKHKLETDIEKQDKELTKISKDTDAKKKEQESRVKQLKKEIDEIKQNTQQHEILQKLLPILPLLAERQKLYDELNPKMTMAKMGEDLQNMFSNARGMLPSMPKMPNMCDTDVTGSASRALSGLSTYLSTTYQDWFEPYNEEFTVHRPPEQLGHLDKDQIADYKYLGKFSMDMDIGDQPFKQVAHLYFNFKDNVFHTEMELDDILAVDKEMERQLGFDPSKYPHGAIAILGKDPEIIGRAISKDDASYQAKIDQIKQALEQPGMMGYPPQMPRQTPSETQE